MAVRQAWIGSNRSSTRSHNLSAILLMLLHHEVISRVQLAEITGLSTTTVTNLIAEMLAQGIVAEEGTELPSRRRSVGRPRTALRLVPEARSVIGVHFGVGTIRVCISDLRARPLDALFLEHPLDKPAEAVLEDVAGAVQTVVARSGAAQRLLGVGVGASGLVDPDTGINVIAPNLGWHNVPVRDWLARRLNLPVYVDNNERGMALAEALFGSGQGVDALAFVYARIGVGAGFVVGGKLYRGGGAGAGEIGHTTIISENGEPCRCGNIGCLETLVSEPAIVRRAEMLAGQDPRGARARALRHAEGTPIERIFTAARTGDPATCALLNDVAYHMGIALANLVNVLNPELIVLGGIFAQGADLMLPTVESTMRRRAFANLGEHVRLQTTRFDQQQVGMIGAAALALNAFFYQQDEGTT
jgi:predicted NBD/HSP70 family sugar kinase